MSAMALISLSLMRKCLNCTGLEHHIRSTFICIRIRIYVAFKINRFHSFSVYIFNSLTASRLVRAMTAFILVALPLIYLHFYRLMFAYMFFVFQNCCCKVGYFATKPETGRKIIRLKSAFRASLLHNANHKFADASPTITFIAFCS